MDLGSAQGMVPATLAGAHPHLNGIGFDLPPVKPVFDEFIARRGVEDRVRFQGGNFFEDALPKADVIVMGHILHDWLIETAGGFDYTGEDCQAWMREVGFSKTGVEPLVGPDSMVIGFK